VVSRTCRHDDQTGTTSPGGHPPTTAAGGPLPMPRGHGVVSGIAAVTRDSTEMRLSDEIFVSVGGLPERFEHVGAP